MNKTDKINMLKEEIEQHESNFERYTRSFEITSAKNESLAIKRKKAHLKRLNN